MKKVILISAIILLLNPRCIQVDPFINIEKNSTGIDLVLSDRFSPSIVEEINLYLKNESRFDACVVLQGDQLIYQYGEINMPYNAASVRKSIFSALYGIAASKGILNLDSTLEELGINDKVNPLTPVERSATIRHLLTARSGIYLPSIGESAGMKRRKPKRGSYLPNEHFYYNNWDFNALPIILEGLTDKKVGDIINEWLAIPLGMKDFVPTNVTYEYNNTTEYPQTRVYISAEDLARFSALYVTGGLWNGKQVIPSEWVNESTQKVSSEPQEADLLEHPFMEGYAYLWWIDEEERTIWADGAGGHFCIIDRQNNLSVVLRNNTGMSPLSLAVYNATNPYEGNESANNVFKFIQSKL